MWAFLGDDPGLRTDGYNVMLYRDDVPNVEVGVEVTRSFEPRGRVFASELSTGRVAMTVHRGPYDQLRQAHAAVKEWCSANALEIAGPRWGIYGDWSDDPAEREVEVFWLLGT